jgi:hypothetical protein
MQLESFSFGSIRIDSVTYEHDVMIDRGEVRKRKKRPSRRFRDAFGHTPLSIKEKIPWKYGRRDRSAFHHGQEPCAPPKAEYICADQPVTSFFASDKAADHGLPVTRGRLRGRGQRATKGVPSFYLQELPTI